jgi:NhaP-type Na+/H+ or K+/H+ antiporter
MPADMQILIVNGYLLSGIIGLMLGVLLGYLLRKAQKES